MAVSHALQEMTDSLPADAVLLTYRIERHAVFSQTDKQIIPLPAPLLDHGLQREFRYLAYFPCNLLICSHVVIVHPGRLDVNTQCQKFPIDTPEQIGYTFNWKRRYLI
jgi:hypothetical protein